MTTKIYRSVFTLEVRKVLSYRGTFWLITLGTLAAELVVILSVWDALLTARGATRIEGRTLGDFALYYMLVFVLGRIVRGADFPTTVANEIYDGSLSRYLVYPVNYLGMTYARHSGTVVVGLIQLMIALPCALALGVLPKGFSGVTFLMTLSALALGHLVHFLLFLPIQLVAFWADQVWSLAIAMRLTMIFLGGAAIPLDLFPAAAQKVLDLLPFQFVFAFPVAAAQGRLSIEHWGGALAVAGAWCAILGTISWWLWRRGLRRYSGVGM